MKKNLLQTGGKKDTVLELVTYFNSFLQSNYTISMYGWNELPNSKYKDNSIDWSKSAAILLDTRPLNKVTSDKEYYDKAVGYYTIPSKHKHIYFTTNAPHFGSYIMKSLSVNVDVVESGDQYKDCTYKLLSNNCKLTIESGVCCVPWWALITTNNGKKMAKDIVVGDLVLSLDQDTGKLVYATIEKVGKPKRCDLIKVYAKSGGLLEFTNNHAIYTNEGWACFRPSLCKEVPDAKQLKEGQCLLHESGEWDEIVKIEETILPLTQFCNFTTSTGTYVSQQYIVHNGLPCPS